MHYNGSAQVFARGPLTCNVRTADFLSDQPANAAAPPPPMGPGRRR